MKVRIDLTPEQTEQLRPLAAEVAGAWAEGKPGMIVGQAWSRTEKDVDELNLSYVELTFFSHEEGLVLVDATKKVKLMRGEPVPVRRAKR